MAIVRGRKVRPSVRVACLAVLMPVLAPGAAMAQPALEGGRWKLSVTATTNGQASPASVSEVCLREELKDLNAYFAPSIEGLDATCTRTRVASGGADTMAYDMRCSGAGFTLDAKTSVTVHDARRFSAVIDVDSRTENDHAVVHAVAEATLDGPCPGG